MQLVSNNRHKVCRASSISSHGANKMRTELFKPSFLQAALWCSRIYFILWFSISVCRLLTTANLGSSPVEPHFNRSRLSLGEFIGKNRATYTTTYLHIYLWFTPWRENVKIRCIEMRTVNSNPKHRLQLPTKSKLESCFSICTLLLNTAV